jgi:hypothetical protein
MKIRAGSRQAAGKTKARATQSDQQESFQVRGLAPGSYLVCALVNHESGSESSPDYLQELAKHAKTWRSMPRASSANPCWHSPRRQWNESESPRGRSQTPMARYGDDATPISMRVEFFSFFLAALL